MIHINRSIFKGLKGGPLNQQCQSFIKRNYAQNLMQYRFSNGKNNEQNDKKSDSKKQSISTIEELRQKTQNQLLEIKNQQISESQKTKKDYRDAVLFEEILRTEKQIPLYDCNGKVFRHEVIKNILMILGGFGVLYYFYYDPDVKPKRRTFNCGLTITFIITRFLTYRRFQKSYVDKVVYDTTTKLFSLTKRKIFGQSYEEAIKPQIMLFTNDKALNKRNINYINTSTLEGYMIGYDYAWKNKALYSHVLEQRVETIRHKKN